MKLDWITLGEPPSEVADAARRAEARGYDGWFTGETNRDPFLQCTLAADATERIEIGTAIAVAFPRSPMHVAGTAHDLQTLSGGRFTLGLGSQIKPHIEKRFSGEWSSPAPRMREFVQALRAIWTTWNEDEPLRFRSEHYRHTLMTPFFTPPPVPGDPPKVAIAAVGPKMTEVAGEVADGVFAHSFTTERYLREVTVPAVRAGEERGGRDPGACDVYLGAFVVTGDDEEQWAEVEHGIRRQIAFYGSTPAYRKVLEMHGWEDLHTELNRLSKQGVWDEMPTLIDDEVLHAFAVVAAPDEVGARLRERFGDVVRRISLYTDYEYDDEGLATLRGQLRG